MLLTESKKKGKEGTKGYVVDDEENVQNKGK